METRTNLADMPLFKSFKWSYFGCPSSLSKISRLTHAAKSVLDFFQIKIDGFNLLEINRTSLRG